MHNNPPNHRRRAAGRAPCRRRRQLALSRAGTGLDLRPHDLRHTAGTFAAQAGANAFLVRDLLGHKTLAMTGRYVERAADPLRALADRVADRVTAAMAVPAEKPGPRGALVRMRAKGR